MISLFSVCLLNLFWHLIHLLILLLYLYLISILCKFFHSMKNFEILSLFSFFFFFPQDWVALVFLLQLTLILSLFLSCFCSTILSRLIFYFTSSVLYLVYFIFSLFRYTSESILLDTIHNLFEILFSYSSKLQFEHFTSCLSLWRMEEESTFGFNFMKYLFEKFKFFLLFWNPVPWPSVSKLFSELCTFPWKTRFAVFLPLNVRACCHKDLFLPVYPYTVFPQIQWYQREFLGFYWILLC